MTDERTFVNELGNTISLDVSSVADQNLTYVTYRMVGPTSETEQTMTYREAVELVDLLVRHLSLVACYLSER